MATPQIHFNQLSEQPPDLRESHTGLVVIKTLFFWTTRNLLITKQKQFSTSVFLYLSQKMSTAACTYNDLPLPKQCQCPVTAFWKCFTTIFSLFSHISLRKLLCLISDLQLKPRKMYSGDTYAGFLSCFAQPYKISQIYCSFQNDNF